MSFQQFTNFNEEASFLANCINRNLKQWERLVHFTNKSSVLFRRRIYRYVLRLVDVYTDVEILADDCSEVVDWALFDRMCRIEDDY